MSKTKRRRISMGLVALVLAVSYILLPTPKAVTPKAEAATGSCTYPYSFYYGYGVVRRSHPAFLGHTVRVSEVECETIYGPGGLLYTSTPSISYPSTSINGVAESLWTRSGPSVIYHTSEEVIYEWQVHQEVYKGLIQQDFVAHLYVYRNSGKLCISGYCQTFWFTKSTR